MNLPMRHHYLGIKRQQSEEKQAEVTQVRRSKPDSKPQVYQNVMESLVEEEVNRQLQKVSPRLLRYINNIEVSTFALNRLPAMYASSQEGFYRQQAKAKQEYKQDISRAVRRALAAVQRDPIRFSTPLMPKEELESKEAKEALQELQDLLQQQELSWKNLTKVIKQALVHPSYKTSILKREPASPSPSDFDWNNDLYK